MAFRRSKREQGGKSFPKAKQIAACVVTEAGQYGTFLWEGDKGSGGRQEGRRRDSCGDWEGHHCFLFTVDRKQICYCCRHTHTQLAGGWEP
jgi:hypothetical protein